MTLLKRYYMRQFLKLFIVLCGGFAAAFSLLDLIYKVDDFMPHSPPVSKMLLYALLNFPKNLVFLMPVGSLLSALLVIGQASRAKELTAVMAAGGRLRGLLLPFVATGAAISLFAFAVGEFAAPAGTRNAAELKRSIVGQPSTALYREGALWFRAKDGSIVNVKLYSAESGTFGGMTVFTINEGSLAGVIEAEEAVYIQPEDAWLLRGVRTYDIEGGEVSGQEEKKYAGLGPPDVIKEEARGSEQMGIAELVRYVKKLREAGFKNQRLSVELHSKAAFPLINLFMLVIGVSLAAGRTMQGLMSAATGLRISLGYFFIYAMMLSMGYAGILPPALAVWSAPAAFAAAAIHLYRGIPE